MVGITGVMSRATAIALTNQKGGVGETTTTRNLARAGQQQGQRVLVIDADRQGNLTDALGAEDLPPDVAGLADALSSRSAATIAEVIVASIWQGVDLVPSGETSWRTCATSWSSPALDVRAGSNVAWNRCLSSMTSSSSIVGRRWTS